MAIVAWDIASRGRVHPATLGSGLSIVVSQPLRLVLSGTEGWTALARWAVELLG